MAENNLIKIGDEIYHKSNPNIKWVVEELIGDNAICITITKDTLEKRREEFKITSISKCTEQTIIVGKRTNNHRW